MSATAAAQILPARLHMCRQLHRQSALAGVLCGRPGTPRAIAPVLVPVPCAPWIVTLTCPCTFNGWCYNFADGPLVERASTTCRHYHHHFDSYRVSCPLSVELLRCMPCFRIHCVLLAPRRGRSDHPLVLLQEECGAVCDRRHPLPPARPPVRYVAKQPMLPLCSHCTPCSRVPCPSSAVSAACLPGPLPWGSCPSCLETTPLLGPWTPNPQPRASLLIHSPMPLFPHSGRPH